MHGVMQDLRYGARVLRNSPGFTLVAVATLALGIGANTAIFSMVNALLLRPLPYRDAGRLVRVVSGNNQTGVNAVGFSVPEMDDLRSKAGVFDELSVIWPVSANLTGTQHPERIELLAVSPNYFTMLSARTQLGRVFGAEEYAQGFAEGIVISDGLWSRSLGRDPKVLGKKLLIDNDPYTIVGVLPPGFRHPGRTVANDVEVWATAGFSANPFPKPTRNIRFLPEALGRLKPGISVEQAQGKLSAFARELRTDYPTDYVAGSDWSVNIEPLQHFLVGDVRPMLLVLMGSVILIVLIACVNIANLLLARASGRQREMAVRLSLGASRNRMVRQMLTEAILLSVLGGILGILTSIGTMKYLLHFVPSRFSVVTHVSIDWRVLGFALLISILTGILFGLAPALQSAKTNFSEQIREGGSGSGYSPKTMRLRRILIVSELALAVVLMVGAGLLLRTFWRLLQEDPGFNPKSVVTASLWLPAPNDPKTDHYAQPGVEESFIREVVHRIGAQPGVDLAGITTDLPMTRSSFRAPIIIEDLPANAAQDLNAEISGVDPTYFKVLQAPLLRGRFIEQTDEKGKPQVALVNEATARRFWGNQDPIGKRLRVALAQRAAAPRWITVVGVVGDIKHDGLDADASPHIYTSIYQFQPKTMSVVLRTSEQAATLEPRIRREIQAVDPSLPIFNVRAMDDLIDTSLAARRFSAELIGAFAVLALILASIGIYGLLAYMVGQKTNEIGIRMALGAGPRDIRALISGEGTLLSGTGIIIGLIFAGFLAPSLRTLLFEIRPFDPVVFVIVPTLLLLVSLLAGHFPAKRAVNVNPMIALRQ